MMLGDALKGKVEPEVSPIHPSELDRFPDAVAESVTEG